MTQSASLIITRTANEALQNVAPHVKAAARETLDKIVNEGKSVIPGFNGTKIAGNYHVPIPECEGHTMVLAFDTGNWYLLAIV